MAQEAKPENLVITIESKDQFNKLIQGDKPVFVDFMATWCGPCKMIAPTIKKLAAENADIVFVKVDVDAQEEISEEYGIQAMPTFIVIFKGKKVDEKKGANEQYVLDLVKKAKECIKKK